MSGKSIKPPTTSNKMFNPSKDYVGTKAKVKYNEDCLKQEKITFNHGKLVNIYIVYELEKSLNISNHPATENCLFGSVKLTKRVKLICTNVPDMASHSIEKDLIQLVMKLEET